METDKLLLDTNIFIYSARGHAVINELLEGKQLFTTFINEIELLSFPSLSEKDYKLLRSFLNDCIILEYNTRLKDFVIDLRKNYKLKMADALVAALALQYDLPVVTADKYFDKIKELSVVKILP